MSQVWPSSQEIQGPRVAGKIPHLNTWPKKTEESFRKVWRSMPTCTMKSFSTPNILWSTKWKYPIVSVVWSTLLKLHPNTLHSPRRPLRRFLSTAAWATLSPSPIQPSPWSQQTRRQFPGLWSTCQLEEELFRYTWQQYFDIFSSYACIE